MSNHAVIGIVFPRRLAERFEGLSPETRARTAELLDRAHEAVHAADALTPLGHENDAQVLLWRARDATREALALVDAARLSDAGAVAVARAKEALHQEDDDEDLRRAIVRAHRALEGLGWTARDVRKITRERGILALTATLAVAAFAGVAISELRAAKTTASAQYGANFIAEKTRDGDAATDWLLPDRTAGYLEVHLHPARHVRRVQLVNCRNLPYNDRGTKQYLVESFRGSEKLSMQPGSFATVGVNEVREVPIDAKVDRVRININDWFGNGGGLAEVKID